MKNLKKYSLLSLFSLLVCLGALAGTFYYFADQLLFVMSSQIEQIINIRVKPEITVTLTEIHRLLKDTREYFMPLVINLFVLTALITWLLIRMSISSAMKSTEKLQDIPEKKDKQKNLAQIKQTKQSKKLEDKTRSLLVLSLLQREGRFIDFLEEKLGDYSDEQIGSAVRNIHENCQKVIQKYLGPKSVMDQQEGDEVTIAPGFDPGLIKLIGNVSGEPPFKGILRHKGWRASKYEMPSISSVRNPEIIAPAEVEIL